MHESLPPLNGLRAFEAAARHLSMTHAAGELSVTPSALSHQIRGLEEFLGIQLFERRTREIALTAAGALLYPGLQSGFGQIREAVSRVRQTDNSRVLVISTPPGFTAKWLAPRLFRFSIAQPEIDVRVSSSVNNANFTTDGVDLAVRNLPIDAVAGPGIVFEKLAEFKFLPVCAPAFAQEYGPFETPQDMAGIPLIHDDTFADRAIMPRWPDWFSAAGVEGVNVDRGVRFNSADHALSAAAEGAGMLLAHDILAQDDLNSGRLIAPFHLILPTGRGYHLVYPQTAAGADNLVAFVDWIKDEMKNDNYIGLSTVMIPPAA